MHSPSSRHPIQEYIRRTINEAYGDYDTTLLDNMNPLILKIERQFGGDFHDSSVLPAHFPEAFCVSRRDFWHVYNTQNYLGTNEHAPKFASKFTYNCILKVRSFFSIITVFPELIPLLKPELKNAEVIVSNGQGYSEASAIEKRIVERYLSIAETSDEFIQLVLSEIEHDE